MAAARADNQQIARVLEGVSRCLIVQRASEAQVLEWARATRWVRAQPGSLADLPPGQEWHVLAAVEALAPALVAGIVEIVATGELRRYQRLQGGGDPEARLSTIPGVGAGLAARIHDELGLQTVAEVFAAAECGSLTEVHGVGPIKAERIAAALRPRLTARVRTWALEANRRRTRASPPSVPRLLTWDAVYRELEATGDLPALPPRTYAAHLEAGFPRILHDEDGPWRFSAHHSTTRRALELRHLRDWVRIHWERGALRGASTIITVPSGRAVRGRVQESFRYHRGGGQPIATAA